MVDFLNSLPEWLKISFGILLGAGIPIGIIITSLIQYIASGREARLKVICIALAIVLTAILSFIHFQTHDIFDTVVYTTKTGTCYHMSGCDHLRSRYATTISQAWEDGFSPCSFCRPNFWAIANPVAPRAIGSSILCLWLYLFLDRDEKKQNDNSIS